MHPTASLRRIARRVVVPVILTSFRPFFLSSVLLLLAGGTAGAEGVTWSPLTLDEALVEAGKKNTFVFVDVWASHCGQCGVMDEEVWATPEGLQLVEGFIPVKIVTDSADGKQLRSRYPITGLPAVMLLQPDGTEIDRVVGYRSRDQFLNDATALRAGFDPLPELEAALAKEPKSLALLSTILEKYLHKMQDEKAEEILNRILEIDDENRRRQSEKALAAAAKYHDYFRKNKARSQGYWRKLLEQFPTSSMAGAAVKATYDHARATQAIDAWAAWVCELTEARPDAGRLNYSVATYANRGGLRGPCYAQAARNAFEAKVGPAWMDSIAVVLEGKEGK